MIYRSLALLAYLGRRFLPLAFITGYANLIVNTETGSMSPLYDHSDKIRIYQALLPNLHISQATCCKAGKHCVSFVPLEKHPQHTDR